MTTTGDVWRQAAAKWNEVMAQVGDDDWGGATTCPDWDVRTLVDHAMHWQTAGAGMLGADVEAGAHWSEVEPKLSAVLDDPSALDGNAEAMGGMPKQQVAGFLIGDLLIHSWDLARSIGADETLPDAAVQATMMGLQRVPAEMLRSSNMFGPPIDVDDDASAQERLLAFTGRRP